LACRPALAGGSGPGSTATNTCYTKKRVRRFFSHNSYWFRPQHHCRIRIHPLRQLRGGNPNPGPKGPVRQCGWGGSRS
jgi:hypothetical protein